VWSAIALSALAFGVLHLPSVAQVLPTLSADVVAYVTLGNACFGLVAGYLYWRRGLEAAIAAHVLAHVLAYAVRG
jgi:membrane protease YdiL (CAAX protease family)